MSRKLLLVLMTSLSLLLFTCDRITQEEEETITTDDSTLVNVSGTILHEGTNQPISDVNVTIDQKPNKSASTDSSGNFTIKKVLITESMSLQFNINPPQGYTKHSIKRKITADAGNQSIGEITLKMQDDIEPISISGTVVDIESQVSLGNARIILKEYLNKQQVTGSNGQFTFSDIKINEQKSLHIIISKSEYESDTLEIEVTPNQDKNIGGIGLVKKAKQPEFVKFLGANPKTIRVKGTGGNEVSRLKFEVINNEGTPIDISADTVINVELENNPGGSARLSKNRIKTNQKGIATTSLISGTVAGVVKIKASIDYQGEHIETNPIPLTIHAGFPYYISVGPTREGEGGSNLPGQNNIPALEVGEKKYNFSASISDKYKNTPKEGTPIYFTTDYGKIMASNETGYTDNYGITTVTFQSSVFLPSATTGKVGYIYAHTLNANNDTISDKTPILYTGKTMMYFDESNPSFSVDYGDEEPDKIPFSIEDINGNPISPGSQVTVTAKPTDGVVANTNFPEGGLPDLLNPGPGATKFTLRVSTTQPGPQQQKYTGTATVKISVKSENGSESITVGGQITNSP